MGRGEQFARAAGEEVDQRALKPHSSRRRALIHALALATTGQIFPGAAPSQAQVTPSQALQQRLQEDQLRLRLIESEDSERDDDQPLIHAEPESQEPWPEAFVLRSLQIDTTLPSGTELEQALRNWLGRSIGADQLAAINASIQAWFRRRDLLVATRFNLDSRADGDVRVRVAPLVLAGVDINPDIPHRLSDRRAIATVTAAVPLETVIRPGKLESALLKLNDLWGVRVRGRLLQGAQPDSRTLVLDVADSDRNGALLELDNYLNRYVGDLRLLATFSSANNLGSGERVWLNPGWWGSGQGTGTAPLQLGVDWPLGTDGLLMSASANAGRYQLFNTGDVLYTGETAGVSLSLSQPLWRRDQNSLWLRLSGEGVHFRDEINAVNLDDKQGAVARASLIATSTDSVFGQSFNTLVLGGSIGTINLGGNSGFKQFDQLSSRLQGTYGALNLNLIREQVFNSSWSARWLLLGQWAFTNLSGYEQCGLGWPNGVRAYPPGENSSSSCLVSQLDLNLRLKPWLKLVGFADLGWGQRWLHPFPGSLQPNSYALAGAGFGLDLGRATHWLLSLRAAFPIGGNPAAGSFIDLEASDPTPRLWAGLQLWL